MQTQSSGFGTGSFMNQTITSKQSEKSILTTGRSNAINRTAKQFFSKDNENHPSIEENKRLK